MPIVAVEGVLGVGKSTLCDALVARRGFIAHKEPVGDDPILEHYYRDPKNYALAFQLFVLMQRAAEHGRAQASPLVQLFDRSILGDFAFALVHIAEGNMTKEEAALYLDTFRKVTSALAPPAAIVMLEAPDDVVLERIHKRGRAAERAVSIEWVEKVRNGYETQLVSIEKGQHPWSKTTRVIRVSAGNGNQDYPVHRALEALEDIGPAELEPGVDTYFDFSPRPTSAHERR